jgi:hypothetical protein
MIGGFGGKEGNIVHKLLGLLVLCLAFMLSIGSVGCGKKSTSHTSAASHTSPGRTEAESTSATKGTTHMEKGTTQAEKGTTKATEEKTTKSTKK